MKKEKYQNIMLFKSIDKSFYKKNVKEEKVLI